ncbi:DUF2490 domain-containing protein [Sphingobium sufflavum]|uniref:DUF2490 domain-containing protein n=1 Tax=Sphingobium sufflavum TaxID=1129547 RepID=UPI001F24FDC6|nr:DUF2490 domain-containing protein [Sphingobium sufflavum]MCE7795811.1 DUF2490 domain-containing protein [Sphingobium sufflavum]
MSRRPPAAPALALFLAALLPWSTDARAAPRQDEQLWVNLTAMGPLSGPLVYFAEVQPRTGDGSSRLDQLLLRGAVGVRLNPRLTLYQGYAHVVVPVDGGRDVNEERSFQQLTAALGKPLGGELSSRTRLEQRWRSDGDGMGWRLRQMLRYETPLRSDRQGPSALVHAELFVAFNHTDWGARSGFDQLRSFAGVEIPVGGASTIEAGYLNQYIARPTGPDRMNHVASLTLFFRH